MTTLLADLTKELLDDQNGITYDAYKILLDMMIEAGEKDLIKAVDGVLNITDGRVYVDEGGLDMFIED